MTLKSNQLINAPLLRKCFESRRIPVKFTQRFKFVFDAFSTDCLKIFSWIEKHHDNASSKTAGHPKFQYLGWGDQRIKVLQYGMLIDTLVFVGDRAGNYYCRQCN